MHLQSHPLAGQRVTLQSKDPKYNGREFVVEDWWDKLVGRSWMVCDGNPAALNYAIHSGFHDLPTDDEVVYGKIGAFGHIIHNSELPPQKDISNDSPGTSGASDEESTTTKN